MNLLLVQQALSLGLSIAAVFIISVVLVREPGRLGTSWRIILAGLVFFALASGLRVIAASGIEFEIEGLSEILETGYVALFAIGMGVKLSAVRKREQKSS